MRVLRRLYLLVWGSDVVPELRPLLAVSLAGSLAGSAGWSFLGIWAVKRLGASSLALGLAFLAGAVLSAGVGYFSGHLSDYLGRRPLILFGWGGQALFGLLFLTVGTQTLYGLAILATIPAFGALGSAADQALVSDLVPTGRREAVVRGDAGRVEPRHDSRPADRRAVAARRQLDRTLPSASSRSPSRRSRSRCAGCPGAATSLPSRLRSGARSA